MEQTLLHVALVVRDYDEAIDFFTKKLSFSLIEVTYIPEQDKRWVLVRPPGTHGSDVLLARPSNPEQEAHVGNQTGGRVSFFLATDDFWRDSSRFSKPDQVAQMLVEYVEPLVVQFLFEQGVLFLELRCNLFESADTFGGKRDS